MALSDSRLKASSAFVARRLLSEGLVRGLAAAGLRRAVEGVLAADRERERELDREVDALLRKNAPAIRATGADHAEMFRKAKRMLAQKKGIPL
ncbi:DUF507 family protein [Acidobacteria bacterium ACD]|nr:MAG: DUF507 family protein [Acidobacteriota bacterium]MCE7957987.1 DUF507 family protein [Acidobacteria bacterium ACB2]MDL1951716.1 DUF507 family protein [Acidobacteria bacterium ACD]